MAISIKMSGKSVSFLSWICTFFILIIPPGSIVAAIEASAEKDHGKSGAGYAAEKGGFL